MKCQGPLNPILCICLPFPRPPHEMANLTTMVNVWRGRRQRKRSRTMTSLALDLEGGRGVWGRLQTKSRKNCFIIQKESCQNLTFWTIQAILNYKLKGPITYCVVIDAFEYLDHQGRGAVILTEQTGRLHLISKSDGKLWKRSAWPHHGGRPGRRVKMGVGGTWEGFSVSHSQNYPSTGKPTPHS